MDDFFAEMFGGASFGFGGGFSFDTGGEFAGRTVAIKQSVVIRSRQSTLTIGRRWA